MYWAQALAEQTKDHDLQEKFVGVANELMANEDKIISELNGAQGSAQNIGGYYKQSEALTINAMRPSETLNSILSANLELV
jgi:isocitrate dehydrogenase